MPQVSSSIKTAFFVVLFVFLFLFIFTKFVGPIPFSVNSVNTTKETLFTVQETGEATAIPDTALIQLGVNKQASTVESAKNEVNSIINNITNDLKSLGIEEKNIKTTNFSVNPTYDYTLGRQRITGYSVDANIQVKVKPIDKANSAIDIATKDGANQVGGIQFTLDDEKLEQLENEARKQAIEKAKQKAKNISSIAGITLGKLVDVQENGTPYPRPELYTMKAAPAADEGRESTQLNPGENKISISVTLSYETY